MRGGQARTRRGMLGMGKSREDSDRRANGKTTRAKGGFGVAEVGLVQRRGSAAGC